MVIFSWCVFKLFWLTVLKKKFYIVLVLWAGLGLGERLGAGLWGGVGGGEQRLTSAVSVSPH